MSALLRRDDDPLRRRPRPAGPKWPAVSAPVPAPSWDIEPAAGPEPALPALTEEQKLAVLNAIRAQMDRDLACDFTNVPFRDFRRAVRDDPEFREDVEYAERCALGDIALNVRNAALENAPIGLAVLKWQHDKDMAREQMRLARERSKNETKVANAIAGQADGEPDLTTLTNDEFFRFDVLHQRLAAGGKLTPAEESEYIQLMQQVCSPHGPGPRPPSAGNGHTESAPQAALPAPADGGLRGVEALFGVDDNESG